jgi:iron(III) transport system substrate-binding protein
MRRLVLSTAIGLAVVLAACGSPSSEKTGGQTSGATGYEQVFKAIKGLHGKAKIDKLAKMAQQEGGALNVYTSLTSDVEGAVTGAFSDAYDIDVNVYRADSETVLKRASEEFKANFHGADVVETDGPEMFDLNKEGVLVDYQPDALPALVSGSDFQGWTAERYNKFVVSWNTDLVPNGQQPKSWQELADPKWAGKVTLEASDVEWYKTLFEWFVKQGMSEQQTQALFEKIARNSTVTSGHTVIGQLMAAGDAPVAASNYSYIVEGLKKDGAPVEWLPPVQPIISRANGVGLVRNADDPAASVLFVEWLLSKQGQKLLAQSSLDVARKDLATAKGAKEIRVDIPDFVAHEDEWTSRYDELIKLGSASK